MNRASSPFQSVADEMEAWIKSVPFLYQELQTLAWLNRTSNPVILVKTSADGENARAPEVLVITRSK
jgi:hypothetical protein